VKVLVTGSAGFIGSAAVEYLSARGHNVRGFDIAGSRSRERGDIGDESMVARAFRGFSTDGVLHLGAYASVPGCEADPDRCLRTNLLGTVHIARAANSVGARLVFAPKAEVYGDRTPVPTAVDAPTQPTNFYGLSKLAGEHVRRMYSPNSAFLRRFNVYGPGCERSYVIPDVIRKLSAHPGVLRMEGTGREARDFVYIEGVLRAMEFALRGRFQGAYNVGMGVRTSVKSLARAIARAMHQPGVLLRFAGPRAGGFRVSLANMCRRNLVPGWRPRVTPAEGLQRVLAAG
jgi:UDP-glucose 4-epimerase